jgi:hypothetical protein
MCCLGSLLVVGVDIDARVERRSELSRGIVVGPLMMAVVLVFSLALAFIPGKGLVGKLSSLYMAGKK